MVEEFECELSGGSVRRCTEGAATHQWVAAARLDRELNTPRVCQAGDPNRAAGNIKY